MTDLTAKALVRCPLSQAERHLAQYFQAHGNREGTVARLVLSADLPLMNGGPAISFERPVIATITPRQATGDMIPTYAVTWAADGGGPYPTFVGSLRIGAMDDYESFELILDGRYEPPLGAIGSRFDVLVGHRIAQSTADSLLHAIAIEIETTYQTEESRKPYRHVG